MNKAKIVNIGLLGLGTVGSGVVRVLQVHGKEIEKKKPELAVKALLDSGMKRELD